MNPEDIPRDVYKLLTTKETPLDDSEALKVITDMGFDMTQVMLEAMGPDQQRAGRLRLSAIGREDRKIYNDYHGVDGEEPDGPTRIKFLYGHLVEAMILALVKLSGHSVTDQQKKCEVEGVNGSMDCTVDGVMVDVKSCSSYGFKKFKDKQLPFDDPFGYVAQIKAYAHSENNNKVGWIAMDKQNGTLCWLGYDLNNLHPSVEKEMGFDIVERVKHVKQCVEQSEQPPLCYAPVPDGQSGNEKLSMGCSYCPYKHSCFPGLRTFHYGSGPRYLTKVAKTPRVVEMVEGF